MFEVCHDKCRFIVNLLSFIRLSQPASGAGNCYTTDNGKKRPAF